MVEVTCTVDEADVCCVEADAVEEATVEVGAAVDADVLEPAEEEDEDVAVVDEAATVVACTVLVADWEVDWVVLVAV